MCTCHGIDISDEKTVRLFYYVAVPLADDALEEDPNLYKGLILNSFSNGFEFVDLGNFKPAAGPPMHAKPSNVIFNACNLQFVGKFLYTLQVRAQNCSTNYSY